jgi:hypothetical protein
MSCKCVITNGQTVIRCSGHLETKFHDGYPLAESIEKPERINPFDGWAQIVGGPIDGTTKQFKDDLRKSDPLSNGDFDI